MRRFTLPLLFALLVAACASGEPASNSSMSTSADTTITTTTASAETMTTAEATTTTTETSTTSLPEIDVQIINGEATGPEVFEVELGDTLDIRVLSDVDEELHVHGYDLNYQLEAGVPQQITFVADVPGIFEVESHSNHTLMFELEVTG